MFTTATFKTHKFRNNLREDFFYSKTTAKVRLYKMVDLDWWYGVGGKALFQKEIMIRTFLLYDGYFWFMGWLESYGDIEVANPTDAWKLRFFTKKVHQEI